MARYIITTRRAERGSTVSARDAVSNAEGVTVVNANDPHMVTIEASEAAAGRLREALAKTHFVEPEIRRSLE